MDVVHILENLENIKLEFISQVLGIQSKTLQQKDVTLDNLQSIQSELTLQVSKIQSETLHQKDVTLDNLKTLEIELQSIAQDKRFGQLIASFPID